MVKPGKKQKKVCLIVGITGMVYAGFRYLLPLVIPFLTAYLFALVLKPSAAWLQEQLVISIGKKEYKLPIGLIGGVEFFVAVACFGTLFYMGSWKIGKEITLFSHQFPIWLEEADRWLTGRCHTAESFLRLKPDCLVRLVRDMLIHLKDSLKETAMPFLMANSLGILKGLVHGAVISVLVFLGTILSLQEMESLKKRREASIFWREYEMVSSRLLQAGKAWLKTQGSILAMTVVICTAGLWMLGNPYYILLGILIGLLDALPILGTGTIFLPWAVFSLLQGNWGRGAALLGLYLICYFLRGFMEARIMGTQIGLTPLESLVSLYVGWKLFGILGFILGPIGLILIEDIVDACEQGESERETEGGRKTEQEQKPLK